MCVCSCDCMSAECLYVCLCVRVFTLILVIDIDVQNSEILIRRMPSYRRFILQIGEFERSFCCHGSPRAGVDIIPCFINDKGSTPFASP